MDTPTRSFNFDQTPTPTKLIQYCEEAGIFHDLEANPFDHSFKLALETAPEYDILKDILALDAANNSPLENNLLHNGCGNYNGSMNQAIPGCQQNVNGNSKDIPLTTNNAGIVNNYNNDTYPNVSNFNGTNFQLIGAEFSSLFGSEVLGFIPTQGEISRVDNNNFHITTNKENAVTKKPPISILKSLLKREICSNTDDTSNSGTEQDDNEKDPLEITESSEEINEQNTKKKDTRRKSMSPESKRERNRLAQLRSRMKLKDEKRELERKLERAMNEIKRLTKGEAEYQGKLAFIQKMMIAQTNYLVTKGLANGTWMNAIMNLLLKCSICGTATTLEKYEVFGSVSNLMSNNTSANNAINNSIINNASITAPTINNNQHTGQTINNQHTGQTINNNQHTGATIINNNGLTTINFPSKYNNDCSTIDNDSKRGIILKPKNDVIKIPTLKPKISSTSKLIPISLLEQSKKIQGNKLVKLVISKSDMSKIIPKNGTTNTPSYSIVKNSQLPQIAVKNEEDDVFAIEVEQDVKFDGNNSEIMHDKKRRRK